MLSVFSGTIRLGLGFGTSTALPVGCYHAIAQHTQGAGSDSDCTFSSVLRAPRMLHKHSMWEYTTHGGLGQKPRCSSSLHLLRTES